MTTSKNQENMKRKVMAKGYCQLRKKKQKGRQWQQPQMRKKTPKKGDGNKHKPKKKHEKIIMIVSIMKRRTQKGERC
jgi:hypothetical protein